MSKKKCDFSGFATKYNTLCSDSRIIMHGAFKGNHGKQVPLMWNHNHTDMDSCIGHCELEEREDGVYAFGYLNDTDAGLTARKLIKNGDIRCLSIFANHLQQKNNQVLHGEIKEVSLVLAGANPGAYIENVCIEHSEESEDDFEARIYCTDDECIEMFEHSDENQQEQLQESEKDEDIEHADKSQDKSEIAMNKVKEVYDNMTEEQKQCCDFLVALAYIDADKNAAKNAEAKHSDVDESKSEENIQQSETSEAKVEDQVSEETKNETEQTKPDENQSEEKNDLEHSNNEEETTMKKNVFEGMTKNDGTELKHSDILAAIEGAQTCGSMKESFLKHGITDVGNFYPESQVVGEKPELISRNVEWVNAVMGAVRRSPFAKVKSIHANITAEEARAKGYVKGNEKAIGVLTALKRVTEPATIYVRQNIDRDDIIDITDFDVLVLMKQELDILLEEEKARAILIGDGRSALSNDKISESKVRPILTDDGTFAVHKELTPTASEKATTFAKRWIAEVKKTRREYKGSGAPIMFIEPGLLSDCLLIEDTNGRFIYEDEVALARVLGVKKLVACDPMDGYVRTNDEETYDYKPLSIMVNLADYVVGKDKKADGFFDQFDIDYNKQKYLKESRMSGALVKFHSAITFELKVEHTSTEE